MQEKVSLLEVSDVCRLFTSLDSWPLSIVTGTGYWTVIFRRPIVLLHTDDGLPLEAT